MRALAAAAALAFVLLPGAAAQTLVQPVQGDFTDVYLVVGRAVDARGEPVAGASLKVELDQKGVRAAPLRATTNCKGDFITSFNLRDPSPKGAVTVTLEGRDGVPNATARAAFDPFFRRSDLVVRLDGAWNYRCTDQDVWPISVSVSGRIVNRTAPYAVENVTYHAAPYEGLARLRYEDENGQLKCPPAAHAPAGVCDFLRIDERGDFRYTFTFDQPVDPRGKMHVVLDDRTHTVAVDPVTRLAVFRIEATGQGPLVPDAQTPGPAPLLLALALAGAALAARRLARR